jgi:hypothetical protein
MEQKLLLMIFLSGVICGFVVFNEWMVRSQDMSCEESENTKTTMTSIAFFVVTFIFLIVSFDNERNQNLNTLHCGECGASYFEDCECDDCVEIRQLEEKEYDDSEDDCSVYSTESNDVADVDIHSKKDN